MLKFSEEAKKRIAAFVKGKDLNVYGLRLPTKDGAFFDLEWVHLGEIKPGETFGESNGVMFLFDQSIKAQIEGAQIDYIPGGLLPGRFQIEFPETEALSGPDFSNPTIKKIQEILDREINPAIAMHGGIARILGYKDHRLYLQMGGGCHGCGGVDATLKQGIEARLRQDIPELEGIVDQTDHASGTNPYFQR